jgi:isopentenyl diphosphate isomerase/L-lactate dehydrogenase-like FMN-dependent dehydrogenase
MSEDAPPPELPFGDYYRLIYMRGAAGEQPSLPVIWADLEQRALEALDDRARGYVSGSAGSEDTARANLEAFRRWRIVPRMLRDVAQRTLATEVLGSQLIAPVMLAPIGVQGIFHADGELAAARGAGEVGLGLVASTVTDHSLEEIAEAHGESPHWFQLYWPNDPDIAASIVARAEAAGYGAIVVTVDNAFPGWKPRDLQQAYLPGLEGKGMANYTADPAFQARLTNPDDPGEAIGLFLTVFPNPSLTWDDLEWLREATKLPILLKGVLHPDDAIEARERGVDGLVVSNHGGRQVDGAISALDALPEIADAVGDDLAILLDSGVRSGADAFKALALGADAVLLGRPYIWGMALDGAAGVETVIRMFLAELDLTMALSGLTSPAQIARPALRRERD